MADHEFEGVLASLEEAQKNFTALCMWLRAVTYAITSGRILSTGLFYSAAQKWA